MKLLTSERFEVTLHGTHGLIIPHKIAEKFVLAGHTRVQYKAFFKDNEIEFHGALQIYKDRYMVSFGKRYQKQLGVFINDYFELQLIENTTKYGVEMPEELSAVLESDPEASKIFENFTDGKKRSLIYYLLRIKNSQTRIDKALIISENMKMGITDQKQLIKKI
jgi:uncharacterized protein YdeI (YjbR/CyaY-like superfamily)